MQFSKSPMFAILSVLTTFQLQTLASPEPDNVFDISGSSEYNTRSIIGARDMTDLPSSVTNELPVSATTGPGKRENEAAPNVKERSDEGKRSVQDSNTDTIENEEQKREANNEEDLSKREGDDDSDEEIGEEDDSKDDIFDLYEQDDIA